jgi:hypothetical protein
MHNIKPSIMTVNSIKRKNEVHSYLLLLRFMKPWDNGRKKCWAVLVIEDDNLKGILSEEIMPEKLF